MRLSASQIFGIVLVLIVFALASLAVILGSSQIQSILGGEAAVVAGTGGIIAMIIWG